MGFLHESSRAVFGLLLDPIARLGPLTSLFVVSAVSGVVLLFAFRWTSRPAAIKRAKQQIQGNLLAVRIYQDDLAVVLRAQLRTFAALGIYLANMLVPFLVILAPFAIFFAHLDARYASRPLRPGEAALLTATVAPGRSVSTWSLEGTPGVVVDSRPVRIESRREVSWRIRAAEAGPQVLALRSGERRLEMAIPVAPMAIARAPRRATASLDSMLFAPTEPAIDPQSGV
ncbi:MAG: hypothetical protein ACREQJ_10925, partial [Candidatus Binatia bacterium]